MIEMASHTPTSGRTTAMVTTITASSRQGTARTYSTAPAPMAASGATPSPHEVADAAGEQERVECPDQEFGASERSVFHGRRRHLGPRRSANHTSKTFRTAEDRAEALGKQWRRTNRQMGDVGDLIRHRNQLAELRAKQQGLGRSSERLERGIRDVDRRYREAKRTVKGYGIEVGRAEEAHRRLRKELGRTERAGKAMAMQQDAGARLGAWRGAPWRWPGAPTRRRAWPGPRWSRRSRARTCAPWSAPRTRTPPWAGPWSMRAASAAAAWATVTEMIDIQYALGSADLSEDVATPASEIVHKVAEVTKGEAGQVGEVIATTFNNLGDTLAGSAEDRIAQIGNILAKTQFQYQIRDFGQLGESLKNSAPSIILYEASLTEASAALGMLNSAGLQAGEAGTALKAMLVKLSGAAAELGTEVVRDASGTLDLAASLQQVGDATAHLGATERADLLKELFDVEGMAGVAPLLASLDKLKEGRRMLEDAAVGDLVGEEYGRLLASTAGQTEMLGQNVRQAGVDLATILLPALKSVITPMAEMAGEVGALIQRYTALAKGLGWAGAAFAAVGTAVALHAAGLWVAGWATATFAGQTALARAAMAGWGLAVKLAAGATWLFNAALAGNPIVWVGAVLVLVAGLVWKYWGPISEFFVDLWNTDLVQAWWATLKSAIAWVGDKLAWLGEKAGQLMGWMGIGGGSEVGETAAVAAPDEGERPRIGQAAPAEAPGGSVRRAVAVGAVAATAMAPIAAPATEPPVAQYADMPVGELLAAAPQPELGSSAFDDLARQAQPGDLVPRTAAPPNIELHIDRGAVQVTFEAGAFGSGGQAASGLGAPDTGAA